MTDHFDTQDRDLYTKALRALQDSGVRFMVGGAFAVYHYTNWWRNTHDIDVYVTHDQVQKAADALSSVGFVDIGEQAAGDKDWIYHSGQKGLALDVIWRFANLVNYITDEWFSRASRGEFLDLNLNFLPLEELIWIKVFVINRHRCDWPDVMRLAQAQCRRLDWDRLMSLLGEHWLLLAALVDVFDWQYPGSMGCIPDSIRDELAAKRLEYRQTPPGVVDREQLLDPWLHQRADFYAIRRNE